MDTLNGPFGIFLSNAQGAVHDFLAQLPLIVLAVIAFIVFVYIARLVRYITQRALRFQDRTFARMVAQLAYIGVLILGGLIAIWIAVPSVDLVDFFASLGITTLILGFALKDMLENFVAGLLILWRHPFGVQDIVHSGAYEGTVEEINFRATVLTTYDGIRVFIPNGRVFSEPLENWTGNKTRRTVVEFSVEQKSPVDNVRELMLREVAGVIGVLNDPPPSVLVAALGDCSIDLRLAYWTAPPTRGAELAVKSEVIERLYARLRGAGVQFPYPTQTIHLVAPGAANGLDAALV